MKQSNLLFLKLVESFKVEIKTTATVHTYGNPETAKYIIFALHGYGQLSRYFIRKFYTLSSDYYIVVPEGLHRFYLQGTSGRVGSSWMTKEKREDDIKDYIAYLDQIWMQLSNKYKFNKRILLGFSQGGATASRWHQLGNYNASIFILWGAIFPPDLAQKWEVDFKETENYFVVGNKDPYYPQEKITEQTQYFIEKNVNFTVIVFDGKHELNSTTLSEICF